MFGTNKFQEGLHLEPFIEDGIITNWDHFEKAFENITQGIVKANMTESPLLITEKAYNSQALRHKMCELAFERFNVPALFVSKDSVMACYSCGRTSGLVVDCGASGTNITPVNDGWAESRGLTRSPVGTRVMDEYSYLLSLNRARQTDDPVLLPQFRVNKIPITDVTTLLSQSKTYNVVGWKNVPASYDRFAALDLGRIVREAVSRVAEGSLADLNQRYSNIPTTTYELPDGRILEYGIERYSVPELYFDPSVLPDEIAGPLLRTKMDDVSTSQSSIPTSASSSTSMLKSVPRLIVDSIVQCEAEIQSSLCAGIVLVGGGACLDGLPERIRTEVILFIYSPLFSFTKLSFNQYFYMYICLQTEALTRQIAPAWRIKTIAGSVSDRANSAWLGGSIVASMGSFHEMWITKQEYAEYGSCIIDRKCP